MLPPTQAAATRGRRGNHGRFALALALGLTIFQFGEVRAADLLPPGLRVGVQIQSPNSGGAVWAKAHFALRGEPRLIFKGDWEAVGTNDLQEIPVEPALVAVVLFQIENSISAVKDGNTVSAVPPRSPGDPIHTYRLEFPLTGSVTPARLTLVNAFGNTLEVTLVFTLQSLQPTPLVILADPACGESGIEAEASSPRPTPGGKSTELPAVVFARCVEAGGHVRVKLWGWQDHRWAGVPQDARVAWKVGREHPVLVGSLPREPADGNVQAFHFALVPLHGGGPSHALTLVQNESRAPSWHLSVALGPTFSSYSESVTGLPSVQVSQVGLTGKLNVQYKFLPSRWDAALGVYGTILPLTESPGGLPGARWLGVNLRAGYTIPLDSLGRNTLSLLPGVYFWSMFVPGQVYGIENLNGPQFVLAYGHELGSRLGHLGTFRWVGAYLKAAVMDSSLGLSSLGNHEFSAGAQVTVWIAGLSHPLAFALDGSALVFQQTGFSMNLTTASFSVGYAFF